MYSALCCVGGGGSAADVCAIYCILYVCIMYIYVVNQYFFDSPFALLTHLTELDLTLRKKICIDIFQFV
jgi:hypothetical protein